MLTFVVVCYIKYPFRRVPKKDKTIKKILKLPLEINKISGVWCDIAWQLNGYNLSHDMIFKCTLIDQT